MEHFSSFFILFIPRIFYLRAFKETPEEGLPAFPLISQRTNFIPCKIYETCLVFSLSPLQLDGELHTCQRSI